jgi:hypothetical protein
MPDEHPFTLRQVDLARADFAAIEDHLDLVKAQLARVPTRMEIARIALGIMFGAAGAGNRVDRGVLAALPMSFTDR